MRPFAAVGYLDDLGLVALEPGPSWLVERVGELQVSGGALLVGVDPARGGSPVSRTRKAGRHIARRVREVRATAGAALER